MRTVTVRLDLNGIACEVFNDGSYHFANIIELTPNQIDLLPHVVAYKARIAELEAENVKLLAAIESWKVEEVLNIELDTERQQRIRELEAQLARTAEPEATVCPGDYCDDGCTKCPC